MIVAGIGCKKGVHTTEVIAAVETALETYGLALTALSALATTAFKRDEEAIFAAGRELRLPVIVVEDETLERFDPVERPLTRPPLRSATLSPRGEEVAASLFSPTGRRWPEGPDEGENTPLKTLSHSDLSQKVAGTPSVSEAAALAAAGEGARLAGPRIVVGPATCAIAFGGDDA